MKWNGLPLLIFGYKGISKETYNLIKQINNNNGERVYDFLGFVEIEKHRIGKKIIDGYETVTSDDQVMEYTSRFSVIGIAIPIGNPNVKLLIYNKISGIKNAVFPNLIHPCVRYDSKNINLGMGNILTAGVNITCDVKIGNFNLINLNSTIGHDTEIGDFNVINPLVAVSGNVTIKNNCLIGTGAKILQQLTIEDNVTIGSGTVVVRSVEKNSTMVGIPAKRIK